MDAQVAAALSDMRKKSSNSKILAQMRRLIPDKTRKQTQYTLSEFFPPLTDQIAIQDECTGAEEIDFSSQPQQQQQQQQSQSQQQNLSQLRIPETQEQTEEEEEEQQQQQTSTSDVSLNNSKKRIHKRVMSTSKKKKKEIENKILDNVYHFVKNDNENIDEVIEEFNENRKSLLNRKSLCKRKLDYQNDNNETVGEVLAVASNEIENTPPPSQTTLLTLSNSINSSRASRNKSREKNIKKSATTNELSLMLPPPPPPLPSSVSVGEEQQKIRSNSEIVISKAKPLNNNTNNNSNNNIINDSASKRKSLTIRILNDLSPIAVKNEKAKRSKNRLNELKQVINDDSKDETELMLSQNRKFLRKSTLRQNSTTTSSSNTRLSVGTSVLSTTSNPFQPKSIELVENIDNDDDSDKKNDVKKKRKRSPFKKPIENTTVSSQQIPQNNAAVSNSTKTKQNSKNKKFNQSYESDERDQIEEEEEEEEEEDIEMRPSPNKKSNVIIIKSNKEKKKNSKQIEEIVNVEPVVTRSRIPVKKSKIEVNNNNIPKQKPKKSETEKKDKKEEKQKNKNIKSIEPVKTPSLNNEPQNVDIDEILLIPETQDTPAPIVEEDNDIIQKNNKKSKQSRKKEKKNKAKILPIEEINENHIDDDDGIRRSKRVKVQAHANLKPIYSLEYVFDCNKMKIPVRKIIGYEKINSDLVKFREKMNEKFNTKIIKNKKNRKANIVVIDDIDNNDNDDGEEQIAIISKKKSKKIQKLQSDNNDIQTNVINEQENNNNKVNKTNKKDKKVKNKKNKQKQKRDKSVDDVSIVYERDDINDDVIADINNNSNDNNFNNQQEPVIVEPIDNVNDNNNNNNNKNNIENNEITNNQVISNDILLSQSYYQYRNMNKNLNYENELLSYDIEETNESTSENIVKFRSKCDKRDYIEISDGVFATACDKLGGVIYINQTKTTILNEHDSDITYIVQRGYVSLKLKEKETLLSIGDVITIPKANNYTIENPSKNQKAYLVFKFDQL